MATNAVIGALRVVLGADTAALEKGLKDAQGKLSEFGANLGKAGAAAAAGFAVAMGAVALAVKSTINEADKLGKSAQKWGVPVDELSRLKHAADLSDVSFEGLGVSLSKLSRNMSEVAGGAKGPASQAFAALGIAVTNADGSLKSSTQVMTDLAGKFGDMEDGAGKTALAISLFGRSGAEIIPLLNSGADGLRKMMREADELGIVIDERTAKAAENFNDNLTRLGKAKDGIILKITAGLLPGLSALSDRMVDAAKNSKSLEYVSTSLDAVLRGFVTTGAIVGAVFEHIAERVAAVAGAVSLVVKGQFTEAWARLNSDMKSTTTRFGETVSTIKDIWTKTGDDVAASAPETGKKLAAPIIKSAELVKETLAEVTKALRDEDALRASMAADASRLIEQAAPAYEQYRNELAKNQAMLAAVGASSEEMARVQVMVAQKFGNTWGQVSESVAGSIKDIGAAFAKESGAMALVAKAAGIVQATISMFVGAAKALELPFPANLAAWASVLATGASMVAGIKATNAGGFATGGAITVPGGMGGGDRVRAMVDLEPGEQLDIWRPGEGAGNGDPRRGAQGGNGPLHVMLQVASDFERRYLEKVVKGIQDLDRDRGGVILGVGKARFA